VRRNKASVTARLQTVGKWVAVMVEDTGHGIEPEHIPHLFERFYRTDCARAKDSGGTGLGLPIVQGVAAAHGGTIAVTRSMRVRSLPSPNPIVHEEFFMIRSWNGHVSEVQSHHRLSYCSCFNRPNPKTIEKANHGT
jgi:hypothetical protein